MTIQSDPQYKLRLPERLRDKIKESASTHNRSMNADIVARLEASFEADSKLTDVEKADYEGLKKELKQEIRLMAEEINALANQVTEYQNKKY